MKKINLILSFIFWLGLGNLLESQALTFTTIQQNGSVDKDIVVSPGELYEVSFDLVGHTTDDVRFVVSEGANVLVDESTLADGAHQYYFTAVSSTVTLTFQRLDPGTDSRMFVVNSLSFLKQEEKVCQNEVGEKQYEVSDHLGNVRATISDNPESSEAEVISAVDYYPFGMEQLGRIDRSPKYRFGFQGQESDSELKGEGNSVNFAHRILDPRLGRFMSVDPLFKQFPWKGPYDYASNTPIKSIDSEGLGELEVYTGVTIQGLLSKKNSNAVSIMAKFEVAYKEGVHHVGGAASARFFNGGWGAPAGNVRKGASHLEFQVTGYYNVSTSGGRENSFHASPLLFTGSDYTSMSLNTYTSSVSYALTYDYISTKGIGSNRVGAVNFKSGALSVGGANDYFDLTKGFGYLGKVNDYGRTGTFLASINLGDVSIFGGYEQFTAKGYDPNTGREAPTKRRGDPWAFYEHKNGEGAVNKSGWFFGVSVDFVDELNGRLMNVKAKGSYDPGNDGQDKIHGLPSFNNYEFIQGPGARSWDINIEGGVQQNHQD